MGCRQIAKHTKACAGWAGTVFSSEGGVLHETPAAESGGERRYTSAANRSRIITGPPHWGQDHGEVVDSLVDQPSSSRDSGSCAGIGAGLEVKRVIAPKALDRFKPRIREVTRRAKSVSMKTTITELAPYMRGWRNDSASVRRLGCCYPSPAGWGGLRAALWRQWKARRRRRAALLALGVGPRAAANTADSGHGPWYFTRPESSPWGSPRCTSARSAFHRLSKSASVTDRTAVYGLVCIVLCEGKRVTAYLSRLMWRELETAVGGFSDLPRQFPTLPRVAEPLFDVFCRHPQQGSTVPRFRARAR